MRTQIAIEDMIVGKLLKQRNNVREIAHDIITGLLDEGNLVIPELERLKVRDNFQHHCVVLIDGENCLEGDVHQLDIFKEEDDETEMTVVTNDDRQYIVQIPKEE